MPRLLSTVLLVAITLSSIASASRGASAFRGDIHQSSQQFRDAHQNTPNVKKADDLYLFFSIHDYDHNGHLDGHELRVAFTEFETKEKGFTTLEDVEKLIDESLSKYDTNNDGLIGWSEWITGQRNSQS